MLKEINDEDFEKLYYNHIINDFPKEERPSLEGFYKRNHEQNEKTYIFQENEEEKAYCIIADLGEYILISFLAVYDRYRGEGIGTKLLKEIEKNNVGKKGIILEVEDPRYAINEEEKIIRERRIKFYQRANYQIIKEIELEMFSVNYEVMIMLITEEEIQVEKIANMINEFYKSMLKKEKYKFIKCIIKKA